MYGDHFYHSIIMKFGEALCCRSPCTSSKTTMPFCPHFFCRTDQCFRPRPSNIFALSDSIFSQFFAFKSLKYIVFAYPSRPIIISFRRIKDLD